MPDAQRGGTLDELPLVELTGQEILEASDKIIEVLNTLRPEAAIAACVLLAYGLVSGRQMSADDAQRVLNKFTTLAYSGEFDVQ